MSAHFDVVVLGAGPGGYVAAIRAAQLGKKTAVVEKQWWGGVCLNVGCIPTKALLRNAELAHIVTKEAAAFGISGDIAVDYGKAFARSRQVSDRMVKGVHFLMKKNRITEYDGYWGTFVDASTLRVAKDDGTADTITFDNCIIDVGATAKMLPGTSRSANVLSFEEMILSEQLPGSIIIGGSGAIGTEFAYVLASYGVDVTIVEFLDRMVPNEDEAISKQLERAFRKRKITFRTNTMFESVERHDGGVTVRTQDGKTHEAEVLLIAVGRGPATANLGYEEVGVAMDRGFVLADEYGRTNVPGVWAVGDIVPGVQLAHRGFAQGIVVAEKIAGLDPTPVDDVLVPKVTFCEPEIASVGLSEAKAAEIHGKDNITTAEFNVAGNAKSQILGTQGFVKLVSLKDGPILGFHAIGARMGEQVGEGQLMVTWEAYADDVAALVHAHPTQNETLGEAAMALAGKPLHNHG